MYAYIIRISGNAASDKNIHGTVSEQLKKTFAKSRWKVSILHILHSGLLFAFYALISPLIFHAIYTFYVVHYTRNIKTISELILRLELRVFYMHAHIYRVWWLFVHVSLSLSLCFISIPYDFSKHIMPPRLYVKCNEWL